MTSLSIMCATLGSGQALGYIFFLSRCVLMPVAQWLRCQAVDSRGSTHLTAKWLCCLHGCLICMSACAFPSLVFMCLLPASNYFKIH
jgi:hypothetical protein